MLENYFIDPFGVVHQRRIQPIKKDYESYYNDIGELSNYMAYLRYGYLCSVIGSDGFQSIVDIGYGNGAFLSVCQKAGKKSYGFDISKTPVPDGCFKLYELPQNNFDTFCKWYDVITMFDSLEHFDDLLVVKDLPCYSLVISVPNCEYSTNDEWFENWKHRKPNEHLHHFNYTSLRKFIEYATDFKYVTHSYVEDVIRKGSESKNILTIVFKKVLKCL